MNTLKKQEIAMYTTGIIGLGLMGLITGAWLELFQMLAIAGSIIFVVYILYKLTYGILDKLYPNTNTITKGGNTIAVNYNCENRN